MSVDLQNQQRNFFRPLYKLLAKEDFWLSRTCGGKPCFADEKECLPKNEKLKLRCIEIFQSVANDRKWVIKALEVN
ncbi:MAG: hypothetical protein LDL41_18425 [Coleofasciculus sp. S288]|nr:hypothetical protein [Coleofasciculus sp. S288]